MSVTSGFFNSQGGDRRYSAEQMAALFNGIITDGVFKNIGNKFTVEADGDGSNNITVESGRAWLNGLWLDNDFIHPLTLDSSDILLDRYDAVVLEMDKSESVRAGSIKIVKGIPSSEPAYPTMTHTNEINQYPLCYILRPAGSSGVSQSQITNMVGKGSLPYITGILQVQDIDEHFAQWEAQWNEWFNDKTADTDEWTSEKREEFDVWFESIKGVLAGDIATELASRVVALEIASANHAPKVHTHFKSEISDFAHSHSKSEISDFPTSMPPSSHTHTASDIGGGAFKSGVKAPNYGNYDLAHTTQELRNIYAGTTDMVAGSTALSSGVIYLVFEE